MSVTERLDWKSLLTYTAMLVGAILLFLLIRDYGLMLQSAQLQSELPRTQSKGHADPTLHVLLALVVIIICSRYVGKLFAYFGQPMVIGEVLAGIALGPSLLGRVAPEISAYVLPDEVAPHLKVIAQLGILLYMFIVGLELDTNALKSKAHTSVMISHASIVTPFTLGSALALLLYVEYAGPTVRFTEFAMFIGVAMSITAFPVLARILSDRGAQKSRLGVIALACAAADDVTAWCLLAIVIGITQAAVGESLIVLTLSAAFIGIMLFVVRPQIVKRLERNPVEHLTNNIVALTIIGLLVSALITEFIGIHAIFGAFLLGAIIPHESVIAREFASRLEDVISILLLPAFFAFTGMRTQIGLVNGTTEWIMCALVLAVAILGKFGGSYFAARYCRMTPRDSAALGVLMNTRGLMELIVLNIGLDLGIISPKLFAMMVIMAVVTTVMTAPLLNILLKDDPEFAPGVPGKLAPDGTKPA